MHCPTTPLGARLRYGGIFKYEFVANFPPSLSAKEFCRSVNICGSYGKELSVLFFWLMVYFQNVQYLSFLNTCPGRLQAMVLCTRGHASSMLMAALFTMLWCSCDTDHILTTQTKRASVSLSCKSRRSKTTNIKMLSTHYKDRSQLPDLYQSVACHECESWLLCLSVQTVVHGFTMLRYNCDTDPILYTTLIHQTHTHTFNGPFSGTTGTRKVKPICILLKQETVSGGGINWAICKSAPRFRQITTPALHHSVFYRPDALPAAQTTGSKDWRQSASWSVQWIHTHTHTPV